jgi:hypothetical protein
MTSKKQRKRGYLLPDPIDGYNLICVQVQIPDAPEYRRAFVGAITELAKWWTWEKDGNRLEKKAARAAKYWSDILTPQFEDTGFFHDCDGCPDCPPGCTIIPLYDSRIEWLPNDPFRTPNLIPDGYLLPPWYIAPAINLIGAPMGSIVTDFARITAIAGWALQYQVPRFRLTVNGSGVVRIHFVNVLQGGLAIIQVDGDIFSLEYVDLQKDVISVPPETAVELIVDLRLTADIEHFIDVQMYPRVDDSTIPVGFGGGVMEIQLCGFANPCQDCPDCPETPCDCGCDDDCGDCADSPDSDCDDCEDCP